ncbi:hypothetical protein ElyMa_004661200 [Elysia marginata]|uniref:Uncharacterized protein n=1 Tax=Elysia marginata TaxID=1093978 RepID=A0AAV4I3M1_9GAST|nr:hypothetical protein ElyMa_004661200 [Elysia marginata]
MKRHIKTATVVTDTPPLPTGNRLQHIPADSAQLCSHLTAGQQWSRYPSSPNGTQATDCTSPPLCSHWTATAATLTTLHTQPTRGGHHTAPYCKLSNCNRRACRLSSSTIINTNIEALATATPAVYADSTSIY